MADELLNFSISGLYSLLILALTFNFLLAMRIRQMQNSFASYTEITTKKMDILTERVEILASKMGDAPPSPEND